LCVITAPIAVHLLRSAIGKENKRGIVWTRKNNNSCQCQLVSTRRYETEGKVIMDRTNGTDDDKLLDDLWAIAHYDLGELFDSENKILSFDKVPAHFKRCISSFEVTETDDGDRITRVTMESRLGALERLGYHKSIRAFCDCAALGEMDDVDT
jgi:hypothetical protein